MPQRLHTNMFIYNACVPDDQIQFWAQNYRGMMFGMFHKPMRDVEEIPKEPDHKLQLLLEPVLRISA